MRFLIPIMVTLAVCAPRLSLVHAAEPATNSHFELRDGDRVVFLGNTFIERAQQYGYLEMALTARYPKRNITFRNLGWSGDTVWAESRGIFDPPAKGYQRMLDHVKRLKPTVIFLGYGANEAFAGKDGLKPFIKQYNKLIDDLTAVSAKGVRFVLLAPTIQINLGPPFPDPKNYNANVKAYGKAIEKIAKRRELNFVDFNFGISLMEEYSKHPAAGPISILTDDGMHWNETEYQNFANKVDVGLHDTDATFGISMSADGTVHRVEGMSVKAEKTRDGLRIRATQTHIPSFQIFFFVDGLPIGDYELRVDGKPVHRASSLEWAKGQSVVKSPGVLQAEQLRQAIIEKNRLYFYRWRPQNITYLFLFRKREQGQNAKEVLEFDKLVAEKEKLIAKLRVPVPRTYELVRVKEDNQ